MTKTSGNWKPFTINLAFVGGGDFFRFVQCREINNANKKLPIKKGAIHKGPLQKSSHLDILYGCSHANALHFPIFIESVNKLK